MMPTDRVGGTVSGVLSPTVGEGRCTYLRLYG